MRGKALPHFWKNENRLGNLIETENVTECMNDEED